MAVAIALMQTSGPPRTAVGLRSWVSTRAQSRLSLNLPPCPLLELGTIAADLVVVVGPPITSRGSAADGVTRGPMEHEIGARRLSLSVEHESVRVPCNPAQVARVIIDERLHLPMVPPAGRGCGPPPPDKPPPAPGGPPPPPA